jgi:hypothetical protein
MTAVGQTARSIPLSRITLEFAVMRFPADSGDQGRLRAHVLFPSEPIPEWVAGGGEKGATQRGRSKSAPSLHSRCPWTFYLAPHEKRKPADAAMLC